MENVLEEIEQIIENEDLTKFLQIIEERVNESDYTAMDLAAAFFKILFRTAGDRRKRYGIW